MSSRNGGVYGIRLPEVERMRVIVSCVKIRFRQCRVFGDRLYAGYGYTCSEMR